MRYYNNKKKYRNNNYNNNNYNNNYNSYYNNNNYNNYNYNNNSNNYSNLNKYDKSYNSIEKITEQIFHPNDKFLLHNTLNNNENDNPKIKNLNKDALPYYPLPSNEGYELFLQVTKKDQYKKTQYSMPFMLSLREKYKEKPPEMNEIRIPQKNEIRSRAKMITPEAYRLTRNYLDEKSDKRTFSIAYVKKNEMNEDELKNKTMILREILNKICYDNYDELLNEILKFDYDEKLLEIFKNLILTKILTEKNYLLLYVNICAQMCKLYNKKTYSNEPKMNFKLLLLTAIQKEFINPNETSIAYPFSYKKDENSVKKFIRSIKYSNIHLISEFYSSGIIRKSIIKDCIDELINNKDDLSISLLCKLIIYTYKKLYIDAKELLEESINFLEKFNNNENKEKEKINLKTEFEILEVLELKEKIKNNDCLNGSYSNLSANPIINPFNEIRRRKSSEASTRRKSSINPKDVEYIKRSRFNSKADELKTQNDNPNLFDEVVKYLNTDLEFYQCFQLNDEEFEIVKEYFKKFLKEKEKLEINFNNMMEELQCERFISVGHLIEIMFSQNEVNADKIIDVILYFFKKGLIDDEDIKHGIVLGLVNFKKNIIDYPNTKKYFQKFIDEIKKNKVLDGSILRVYQRCCDNMEKCFD